MAAETSPDPLIESLTAEGIGALCDRELARAEALLAEIHAIADGRGEATFASVLGRLDAIGFAMRTVSGMPYLMGEAHPDEKVREAARACEPRTDAFETKLWMNEKLATAVRMVAARGEALDPESARLLAHTERDLRRNGLELGEGDRARLSALNEELTKLGQDFAKNIAEHSASVEVPLSSLEGLPDEYVAAKNAKAGPDGQVAITIDYPDYFPFVRYAKDRGAARRLYFEFENRAAKGNLPILDRLLVLREQKAKLLGHATWADYVLEPRMARSADAVRAFLAEVRGKVRERAVVELSELREVHASLGFAKDAPIYPPDRLYLEEQARRAKYGLDSREVAQHFQVERVRDGVLALAEELFGIELRRADAPVWHEDVLAYDVREGERVLGRLYLDLHPRPSKFKHAAVFGLLPRREHEGGRVTLPAAALVCNFAKPEGGRPALMSHDNVVTTFHEMGHALHQLLTETRFATFSGTATSRDFVETPSQAFEEWAWRKEVLDRFARHVDTGAKLPDSLFAAMKRARGFGRALATQRQLFLAALDFEYHTRPAGFDTTAVLKELWAEWQPFAYLEGTHFQAGFGHLVGYDAGYYGYQWALSLARDVLTRFDREGYLAKDVSRAWRDAVLARGGGVDETEMLTTFLGRAPSADAYVAFLSDDAA